MAFSGLVLTQQISDTNSSVLSNNTYNPHMELDHFNSKVRIPYNVHWLIKSLDSRCEVRDVLSKLCDGRREVLNVGIQLIRIRCLLIPRLLVGCELSVAPALARFF